MAVLLGALDLAHRWQVPYIVAMAENELVGMAPWTKWKSKAGEIHLGVQSKLARDANDKAPCHWFFDFLNDFLMHRNMIRCCNCRCLILFLELKCFFSSRCEPGDNWDFGWAVRSSIAEDAAKAQKPRDVVKTSSKEVQSIDLCADYGQRLSIICVKQIKGNKTKKQRKKETELVVSFHRGWGVPAVALHSRRWAITKLQWEMNQKVCAFPTSSMIFRAVWNLKIEMRSLSGTQMSKAPSTRMTSQPACAS